MAAPALGALPKALALLADGKGALFIRNTMHELGVRCGIRRRGDTNIRIDAVASFSDGKFAAIEIEFTNAVVESPRALLEDVAVMHSRYGLDVHRIYPISIVGVLPNARSDYYRVIDDIRDVLELECRTFTLPALLIPLWNLARIATLGEGLFSTRAGDVDLYPSLRAIVPKLKPTAVRYPGAFQVAK
jgi:hypothetical protein